jgi:hypothetical protein
MSKRTLQRAAEVAEKAGHVFVATADAAGLPQVERELVVRVERILSFTPAPHTDEDG